MLTAFLVLLGVLAGAAAGLWFGRPTVKTRSTALTEQIVSTETEEAPMTAIAPVAFDALPLGLVLFDIDGVEVFRNQFARTIMGQHHLGPLVSAAVFELAELAVPRGSVAPSAANLPEGPLERTLDLYGPPRRNIELRVVPVPMSEGAAGSMVIFEDVTEQRRVDEVRRDFVANVSHELKTPVGAISLLAEALTEQDDPETTARLTGRLQHEAVRLANTIDDLLALSEIESDRMEPVEVSVDEVIASALARSSTGAHERSISLRVDQCDEPLVLFGDKRQLVSALGNLVDNAVKYSDPGSEVWVRAERDDDRIVLRVEDRGIGIPQADLGRIFERFYRVDPARSRSTGGTGLGLSIVRHVAMNHDGHVAVRSTEGVGTTFTLHLPAATEEVPR